MTTPTRLTTLEADVHIQAAEFMLAGEHLPESDGGLSEKGWSALERASEKLKSRRDIRAARIIEQMKEQKP